jgi:biopolymer transport protein ExbD
VERQGRCRLAAARELLSRRSSEESPAGDHLRADRGVKYDLVAKVLASAQHNRMEKMGFVNTAEFNN